MISESASVWNKGHTLNLTNIVPSFQIFDLMFSIFCYVSTLFEVQLYEIITQGILLNTAL